MTRIRVGSAVINQTPLDWEGNAQRIRTAIAQAKEAGVTILCLPELCISGYGCEDAFHSAALHKTALEMLETIVPETRSMIVALGLPVLHRNGLYSTACLAVDGQVQGFVAKRYLAGDGIHYEPRWFKAWPAGQVGHVQLAGQAMPIGDVSFECGGVRIGFEICEDAWAAKRPGADLAEQGTDIILSPSASHFAFGKIEVRRRFVLDGSRAFGASYLYSNLTGNESGRAIYDGGAMIASMGKMLAEGPRFLYSDTSVTSAVIDVSATRMAQARATSLPPAIERAQSCISVPFDFPSVPPQDAVPAPREWETGAHAKDEELARAVALGLFDYMRKSRSAGFVVSLSGGADSASIACLVKLMMHQALDQLGLEGIKKRLAHIGWMSAVTSEAELMSQTLTCAYQATVNSSETTRNAARAVAEGVGATFYELNVDDLVKGYVTMAADALGRELTWEKDDLALQNIQARVRAPSVWLLANVKGALLLATSNRSEAAVGYATMDGDTCGGLSPIAGIDKHSLRGWLRWRETEGLSGHGPMPFLKAVNDQQPTAELRPEQAGQTDEQDLMPYDVLGKIEKAAIRDKLPPVEVWHLMTTQFPDHAKQQMARWVERFFRLWSRNQWKRERYAPSFHLDDENLDPKTWCRFPILSGGFDRELAELRAAAAV